MAKNEPITIGKPIPLTPAIPITSPSREYLNSLPPIPPKVSTPFQVGLRFSAAEYKALRERLAEERSASSVSGFCKRLVMAHLRKGSQPTSAATE